MTTTAMPRIYNSQEYIRYLIETDNMNAHHITVQEETAPSVFRDIDDDVLMLLNDDTDGYYCNFIDTNSRSSNLKFIVKNISDVELESVITADSYGESFLWVSRMNAPYIVNAYGGAGTHTFAISIPGDIETSTSTGTFTGKLNSGEFKYRRVGDTIWSNIALSLVSKDLETGLDGLIYTTFESNDVPIVPGTYEFYVDLTFEHLIFGDIHIITSETGKTIVSHMGYSSSYITADYTYDSSRSGAEVRFQLSAYPEGGADGTGICLAIDLAEYDLHYDGGAITLEDFVSVYCSASAVTKRFEVDKADIVSALSLGAISGYDYKPILILFGFQFPDGHTDFFHSLNPLFWDGSDFIGLDDTGTVIIPGDEILYGYLDGTSIYKDSASNIDFSSEPLGAWGSAVDFRAQGQDSSKYVFNDPVDGSVSRYIVDTKFYNCTSPLPAWMNTTGGGAIFTSAKYYSPPTSLRTINVTLDYNIELPVIEGAIEFYLQTSIYPNAAIHIVRDSDSAVLGGIGIVAPALTWIHIYSSIYVKNGNRYLIVEAYDLSENFLFGNRSLLSDSSSSAKFRLVNYQSGASYWDNITFYELKTESIFAPISIETYQDAANMGKIRSSQSNGDPIVVEYYNGSIWKPFAIYVHSDIEWGEPIAQSGGSDWGHKLRTQFYSFDNQNIAKISPLSIFDMKNWLSIADPTGLSNYIDWTTRTFSMSIESSTDLNQQFLIPYSWLKYDDLIYDLKRDGSFVEQTDNLPITIQNQHAFYNLNVPSVYTTKIFKADLPDICIPFIPIPEDDIYRIGDAAIPTAAYESDVAAMNTTNNALALHSKYFFELLLGTNGLIDNQQSIAQPYVSPIGIDSSGNITVGTSKLADANVSPVISLMNAEDNFVNVTYYGISAIELDCDGLDQPNVMNDFIVGGNFIGYSRIGSENIIQAITSISTAPFPFGEISITPTLIDTYGHDDAVGSAVDIINRNIVDPTQIDIEILYVDGHTLIYAYDNTGNRSTLEIWIDGIMVDSSDEGWISHVVRIPFGEIKPLTIFLKDEDPELLLSKNRSIYTKYLVKISDANFEPIIYTDPNTLTAYTEDAHTVKADLHLANGYEILATEALHVFDWDEIYFVEYNNTTGHFESLVSNYVDNIYEIEMGPNAYNELKTEDKKIAPEINNMWVLGTITDGFAFTNGDFKDFTMPHVVISIPDKIGLPPEEIIDANIYLPVNVHIDEDWNAIFTPGISTIEFYPVTNNIKGAIIGSAIPITTGIRNLYIREVKILTRADMIQVAPAPNPGEPVDYILTKITVYIEGEGSKTWEILSGVCKEVPT